MDSWPNVLPVGLWVYVLFPFSLFLSYFHSQIKLYDKRTAKLLEAIESRILQWFGFLFIFLDLGKHSLFCLSVSIFRYFERFDAPFIWLQERKGIRSTPIIWHNYTTNNTQHSNALVSMKLFSHLVHCRIRCALIMLSIKSAV